MAVAELTGCPSIPEKVTVDEYIELSKEFSSDRSKLFINGILDKLVVVLRSKGRISKSGRGLMES
jgi:N utilization substance protein B